MTLEEIRNRKIQFVINSLKNAKNRGISVDYEKILGEICLKFGTARRTSMDYLELAIQNTGMKVVSFENRKEIVSPSETYDEKKDSKGEWTYLAQNEIKLYSGA